jgi:type VI secretion system secreted protein Hcp
MASDIFAKIGDIKGESLKEGHKDEIDVLSYSWGVSQAGTMAFGGGAGAGAGKAQFSDFAFTTNVNRSSPLLFKACATGEHIKEATITVRKAGGNKAQDYLILKMTDVMISSYNAAGSSEGDRPTESINMAFAKIEFTYKTQNSDGVLGDTFTAGWDLKANKKV